MNIILYLITDIIDFTILNHLLKNIGGPIRCSLKQNVLAIILHGAALALVNCLEIPLLNLATCALLFITFSIQYKLQLSRRIMYITLYLGLGFLVEPLCFMLFECFLPPATLNNAITLIVFLCELFRFVLVHWIVLGKTCRTNLIPVKIILILELIPVLTVICSCILIQVMQIKTGYETGLLCLFILTILFINNVVVLYVIEYLNNSLEEKKRTEALLEEVSLKDEYYNEIRANNRKIARIKHNLKNQLTAFYRAYDSDHAVAKQLFQDAITELSASDSFIYTRNPIVNTILNVKNSIAVKHGISITYNILIPDILEISPGEVGVLFGNLLDNAIEACCMSVSDKRISMKAKMFSSSALVIICENSISTGYTPILTKSEKKPAFLHHHGVSSVIEIVNHYSGTIDFRTDQHTFTVEILIYL